MWVNNNHFVIGWNMKVNSMWEVKLSSLTNQRGDMVHSLCHCCPSLLSWRGISIYFTFKQLKIIEGYFCKVKILKVECT